jgi:2-keto-4-pentenoate hydratase
MRNLMILLVLLVASRSLLAECPGPDRIAQMSKDWSSLTPIRDLGNTMSIADAECARDGLVNALHKSQGRQVGYKAGLTNKTVQQRFGHDAPVLGILLEKMLLQDGSMVSPRFGARPLMEADLIVEVKDEGINRAKTPAEVMNHLSRIIPFIELPDLILDPRETLNGPNLIAINVGARLGVIGKPFAASPALIDPLAEMTVLLRDQNGVELGKGAGSAILGHPLNAVIWIAQDLAKSGQKLKAGDLLSLGSFSAPIPPKAGQQVTAIYAGLPGAPSVSVRFK